MPQPFGNRRRSAMAVAMLVLGIGSAAADGLNESLWMDRSRAIMDETKGAEVPAWLQPKADPGIDEATARILNGGRRIQEATFPAPACSSVPTIPDNQVLIFASESLPEATLKNYMDQAKEDGVVVVFRGIKGGDIKSFARGIARFAKEGERPPNVILDPTLFKAYGVAVAPTLALVRKGKQAVTVRGAMTVDWLRRKANDLKEDEAVDLGQRAEVYEISEVDLIEEMQRRVLRIDWDAKRQAAIDNFWKRLPPYVALPEARATATFEVDTTFEVAQDIVDQDGKVLIAAGERINPFETLPLSKTIVVFDGTDKRQVDIAADLTRQVRDKGQGIILITTAIDREQGWQALSGLENALASPVYLLPQDLADKLKLRAVPSVVRGQGSRVFVTELAVKKSDEQ